MQAGMLSCRRPAASSCDIGIAPTTMPQRAHLCKLPSLRQFRLPAPAARAAASSSAGRAARRLNVVATYPEPETEKERSPIDYPQVGSRSPCAAARRRLATWPPRFASAPRTDNLALK
jgi:hypothetical protein